MSNGKRSQEHTFDPVPTVIEAVRRGELVVVADDEQRENEGDLICAAEHVSPAMINFMARWGRGLVCVALTRTRLQALDIRPARIRGHRDHLRTAFMESVDASRNITTGISAADRACTIRLLVDPSTAVDDLVSPGHVFPLEAAANGVLTRPGHTEAAVDLARLAGCRPAGVICEIIRDDGAMARLPELAEYVTQHRLKFTSVAELVAWRRCHAPVLQEGPA